MLDSLSDRYLPAGSGANLCKATRLGSCPLLSLPTELIDSILVYLSPVDLASVSATCHELNRLATAEIHWLHRVQANVPGVTLTSSYPCKTYQELYGAHDPRWFLPKYKIWFCDRELTGKMIVVRYDQRRGCIEGYQLLAISNQLTFQHWSADQHVIIHTFEPQVKLHLDKPVLRFHAREESRAGRGEEWCGTRFAAEVPMNLTDASNTLFSNFLLARPLEPEVAATDLAQPFPYNNVWPPPAIPARQRVAAMSQERDSVDAPPTEPPQRRADASDQAFRIRHWVEMGGLSAVPGFYSLPGLSRAGMLRAFAVDAQLPNAEQGLGGAGGTAGLGTGMTGLHVGEVITYSTLDPKLYTPTALKPWRGIWVGDYSGHGCEFLLVNQPDDPDASDDELGLVRGFDETEESWVNRQREARVYRGRLEAIKLTGDPNVPRGEYTFVADDLGDGGFVGVAQEPPFLGTRIVRSKGHVAQPGFRNDKYIESQLLLVSHNRLAQYWVGFGHISFFERVDIDQFLVP